jgi:hypothetical protein
MSANGDAARPLSAAGAARRRLMLYAVLAYHDEQEVQAWTDADDATQMARLDQVHTRLTREGRLGPAARLGATATAVTVGGEPLVLDGPFIETKEALLGLYLLECASLDEAIASVQELKAVNPGAIYEIRPVVLYLPGVPLARTETGLDLVRPRR